MIPPTLGLFLNPKSPLELVLKYDLIFVVFLQIYSWRLSPLNRSHWRWAMFGGCLAVILVSVVSGHHFEGEGARRLSGVFHNPNNLALIGLALPFFLNEEDSRLSQVLVHGAALVTIALTGTLGAILGYAVGMTYRLRAVLTARRAAVGLALVVVAAALLVDRQEAASQLRLFRQFAAIQESLSSVQGDNVEYGAVVEAHGVGSTSAVWRLTMWMSVMRAYVQGSPVQWLLGRGLGASYGLFGILPHNDFLRLLLETGAMGLVAFLGLCCSCWRGMRPQDRYVVPMVLTFCVSENNLDNFMFMSLFMFFLASTQPPVRAVERAVSWSGQVRQAAWARVNGATRDARAPR
jgi:O-antigen ligase